ncbi:hypothetical protein DICPUDRAFT_99685 [Dictyostelium purpureum]|uniref:GATA-type domain-containing protein n=1 Tax=Dictyostelium purpureum TaxID=5786 RepID=F1A1J2_DICPU|nr:uncharacterized protein DICPUDRAFT_99685 [Dictyostelium purpureum]EGC29933.1 hypothetical protein DICPUDRAFT_99685 [Dictyostelium purpureum]|eukprot:XP_003293536.1 hypothetical protein DICPUDRAFT_99685 [Dictyostelium purpureum]
MDSNWVIINSCGNLMRLQIIKIILEMMSENKEQNSYNDSDQSENNNNTPFLPCKSFDEYDDYESEDTDSEYESPEEYNEQYFSQLEPSFQVQPFTPEPNQSIVTTVFKVNKKINITNDIRTKILYETLYSIIEMKNNNDGSEIPKVRKYKRVGKEGLKTCFICRSTYSPEWRKGWVERDGFSTHALLCNKCGLRIAKQKKSDEKTREQNIFLKWFLIFTVYVKVCKNIIPSTLSILRLEHKNEHVAELKWIDTQYLICVLKRVDIEKERIIFKVINQTLGFCLFFVNMVFKSVYLISNHPSTIPPPTPTLIEAIKIFQ